MLAWALSCALAAARAPVPLVVRLVAVLNLGYVLASILAGVDRFWPLTGPGEAVLVGQTVGVAGIAAIQLLAGSGSDGGLQLVPERTERAAQQA